MASSSSASTSSIINPVTNTDRALESSKKKKRRKLIQNANNQTQTQSQTLQTRWKSDVEQQIYSSKLLEALRHVRRNPSSSPAKPLAVREAADRALAVAAKGRTRWSRAILKSRIIRFQKFKKTKKVRRGGSGLTATCRLKKPEICLKQKSLPPLQRRVKVLGRLVPGCRKVSFPVILDEATDYIAALEMQVRAMTALTELLTGMGSGSGPGSLLGGRGSSSLLIGLGRPGSDEQRGTL